jgi:transglutaminase-like putative cysteine protease
LAGFLSFVAVLMAWPHMSAAQSDGPILHEYVEPGELEPTGGTSTGSAGQGDASPGGGAPPSGRSTQAGPPPDLTLDRRSGEVIRGPGGPVEEGRQPYGPASPGGGATLLDDKTDTVDPLNYHATFDPSVYPYKRDVAQNLVAVSGGGSYQMTTRRGQLQRVSVGGDAAGNQDTFWGTFLIRADAGALHPIPSVAPNQRVLEMHAEPSVSMQPLRDEAGNWYLRIDADGLVRVTMRVAAPHFYFEGGFNGDVSWSDFGDTAVELPERARRVAGDVVETIGVSRQQAPGKVVRELVRYFRNFETRALSDEERAGDLYRTISTRQVGVCRHRSLAFVITARSLGIPVRYVSNEAHAFIEVWWPGGGWRRIDLGGAARDIAYRGSQSSSLHRRGSFEDLPTPPRFDAALERASGQDGSDSGQSNGDGASGEAASSASQQTTGSQDDPSVEADVGTGGQTPSAENSTRSGGADAGQASPMQMQSSGQTDPANSAGQNMEGEAASQDGSAGPNVPTRLTMAADRQTVLRGSSVELSGELRTQTGAPLPNRTVRILIGSPGARTPDAMRELTTVSTDADGQWKTTVAIPESTSIGRWSLVAQFPGDASNASSIAR